MDTQNWLQFHALVNQANSNVAQKFRQRVKRIDIDVTDRALLVNLLDSRLPTEVLTKLDWWSYLRCAWQLRQIKRSNTYGEAEDRLLRLSDAVFRHSLRLPHGHPRRTHTFVSIRLYALSQAVLALAGTRWATSTSRRLSRFMRDRQLEDDTLNQLLEEVGRLTLVPGQDDFTILKETLRLDLLRVQDHTLRSHCLGA